MRFALPEDDGAAEYALDSSESLGYIDIENQKGDRTNENDKNSEVLGRQDLSTSYRGRNGLWKQGQDPEAVYQRLADSQNGEGGHGKTRSGRSGWLGETQGNKLSVLRLRKGLLRDLRGRQLSGIDTAGRVLPSAVKKALRYLKLGRIKTRSILTVTMEVFIKY